MKTKEEIREKHLYANGLSVNRSDVGKRIQKAAFDAMDEYAKGVAIEFAEWCNKNYVLVLNTWFLKDDKSRKFYSTPELYEIFLNEINNK